MISISQQARYLMTRLGLTQKKIEGGGTGEANNKIIVVFLPAKFNELRPTTVVHTPFKTSRSEKNRWSIGNNCRRTGE